MKRLLVFLMMFCALSTYSLAQNWIGTWATAPQTVVKSFMPYNNCMTNRSVRQVVKVSIGGDVIRLKLSNIYSMQPVEIRSIYIAHAKDSSDIDAKTAQYFKFGNSYKTVIPAGKQIVSNALKFKLRNLERVAITINYTSAPEIPTVHMGSRTTSYIMKGVTNAHSNFAKAFRENHWYNISGIDVYTMSNNMSAIAIIGNSITDGKCSTDNAQNRWPDVMSEMLQLKHKITNQGVLNLGIGNNRVTVPGGFGALAKERFDRDILMQSGVKKVVIFEGVNDIGAARSGSSETVARKIIESIQGMMKKAKARKMKVYLGTITPFKGAGYYTHFHEAARLYVNDWIRSQAKNVDGILDFAKLLQDPNDDRRMKREYASNDWLHPNPTGYKAMGIYAADIVK
ncbi:GDSL-type esterase/lipase family protein [Prevotella copri]|uniref:GDSL-type esterase/lipase family protein n=1 Tax=Segatella copri TaxID=165179 RepID=A0AAW5INU1_9BACT|nr:GDSL-type esterase/lipase family protein [Segatella copri]MCP9535447.1 GDSL-type esterase/lipase family protein [Segatella copri]MCP9538375.1 GDSL-type esterase/lipase family protein [Segatella copri]MCP9541318.1 GDSL-type esterase/lipase family protein [Segatella copri]MCP9559650.1 GDSL-type esterase/lipase family protein [Segatella copri]MCP9562451.1 GDSL-type esterase/lipase family protein [Segatella copri]